MADITREDYKELLVVKNDRVLNLELSVIALLRERAEAHAEAHAAEKAAGE